MKLKNLLFATMIACAFASCSNDDDPINDGGDQPDTKADAALSIAVRGEALTKAAPDASVREDGVINDLTIAIFNNGAYSNDGYKVGDLVIVAKAKSAEITNKEVTNIAVRTGGVKIVALANVGSLFDDVTTLDGYLSKKHTITTNIINGTNDLAMSSNITDLTVVAGKNYVGYGANPTDGTSIQDAKVDLYRTVARVTMGSISFAPSLDDQADYIDPSFDLKDIFLMNAQTETSIFSNTLRTFTPATIWGSKIEKETEYLCGAAASFTGNDNYYNKTSNAQNNYYFYKNALKTITLTPHAANNSHTVNKSFYVYENTTTENPTLMVIHGTFKYKIHKNDAEPTVIEDTYYTVAINNNKGSDNISYGAGTPTHTGIIRNVDYTVNVTIKGAGSTDPTIDGTGRLDVAIDVKPYGSVIHNADRE